MERLLGGDASKSPSPSSPFSDSPQEEKREADTPLAGKSVVIVEDEGVTVIQLRRTLVQAGLKVAGMASNGQEGAEMVLRERPDLVLMDIQMPVMNGLEATRRILETYPVCIVILTAFSTEEYQQQAHEVGASGYILKPITGALLLPQLETAYQQFQASPPTQE
ncbi:MAG TPA: response regulator [Chthonomonadaceae bacterium]|nr:response regulator [Chthonomonadaceae bacterium]